MTDLMARLIERANREDGIRSPQPDITVNVTTDKQAVILTPNGSVVVESREQMTRITVGTEKGFQVFHAKNRSLMSTQNYPDLNNLGK